MKGSLSSLLLSIFVQCLTAQESKNQMGSISFAITTDTIARCDSGLTNAGVYAVLCRNLKESSSWDPVGEIAIPPITSDSPCQKEFSFNFTYPSLTTADSGGFMVQFRLLQWEHGGGYCHCWGLVPESARVHTSQHDILLTQQ